MDPTAVSYSLWLMPDPGEVQERLDNLVERMARELNAPRFDFHVTLLGGIKSANLPDPWAESQELKARIWISFLHMLRNAECHDYLIGLVGLQCFPYKVKSTGSACLAFQV